MKRLMMIGGIAVGILAIVRATAGEPRDEKTKKQRVIALSEIVSTSNQRELMHASTSFRDDGVFEHTYGYHLQQIVLGSKSGASNLFLVDATNIDDAVRASSEVLLGGRDVATPATADSPKPMRGSHWLVAYLGIGHSSPPKYVTKAVYVEDKRIRFSYHAPEANTATADVRRYYYWVPLGKLNDGNYEVELFDTNLKEISLMRRVRWHPILSVKTRRVSGGNFAESLAYTAG